LCMCHRRPERRCICVCLRNNDSSGQLRLEQRPRDAVSDFQGTFDRYSGPPSTEPIAIRDSLIRWRKDLGRALDYLQTRTDIDPSKIAYMGHSLGAEIAPMLLATEPRVSVAVLLSGGLARSEERRVGKEGGGGSARE